MNKRDLKVDLEQIKRTKKMFEPQQVTFETPEDEIVPAIDILDQQIYALFGLGEFTAKYGEEWLERAIEAEAFVRELVVVIDTLLVWWRSGNNVCKDCPNTSGPATTCISECCDFLDDYKQANGVLHKVKEVLE